MNSPHAAFLAATMAIFAFGAELALGQLKLPPNPNDFTKRKLGENGGSSAGVGTATVSPGGRAVTQTVIVQIVAVSPLRVWTSEDGRTMTARLLAFSAPVEGETGPVEVIREGKVRFLLAAGKEPVDFPLEKLSQSDQIDIKAIAQAAKRGAPEKPSEDGKAEEAETDQDSPK